MSKYQLTYFVALLLFLPQLMIGQTEAYTNALTAQANRELDKALELYRIVYLENVESFSHEEVFSAIDSSQKIMMSTGQFKALSPIWAQGANLASQWKEWDKMFNYNSAIYQIQMMGEKLPEAYDICKDMLNHPQITPYHKMRFKKALGDVYRKMNEPDSARIVFEESLVLAKAENDSTLLSTVLASLAGLEGKSGNKLRAIQLTQEAIPYTTYNNIRGGMYKQLADLFYDIRNYEKAKYYAELCVENGGSEKVHSWIAHGKAVLGQIAMKEEDFESAVTNFEAALPEFSRNKFNSARLPVTVDLAKSYHKLGNNAKRKELMEIADQLFKENKVDNYAHSYHSFRTSLFLEEKKYNSAKQEIAKINSLLDKNGNNPKAQAQVYKYEAQLLELNKQYVASNKMYKRHYEYKDSLEKAYNISFVEELDAQYQKTEQEKAIASLEYNNKLSETRIAQQRSALIFGGIALLLLGGLLLWVYRLFKTNKQNKEKLASQNTVINKALDEKNVLLQEIHHRVKNNLQVISSLLSLQSRYIKDDAAMNAINASKGRVQSMSLLHQNLYRDENLKGVDMQIYFENLVENLFHTYKISDEDISFHSNISPLILDVDTVVPLGLIANELITNALKHAFESEKEGKLEINLEEKDNMLMLSVVDNGKGLQQNELPLRSGSMGAKLVHSFVEKLNAEMKVDGSNGTKITIGIRNYKLAV